MTKKRRVKTKDLVREYAYIQDDPFTVTQAAEELGVSTSGVGVQLRYLVSKGCLRRVLGANSLGVPCYYYHPVSDRVPMHNEPQGEVERVMINRILQYGGGPFAVMAAQVL